MKKTPLFNPRGWLASVGLLCAAAPWGNPVPTGPISEYLVHCRSWMSFSAEACAGLADRLAAVELPTRAEGLALLMAQGTLARSAGLEADECPGLAAIAADHPDYAYALYFRSYCVPKDAAPGGESSVALLKRAAEIEPDNYLVLERLLWQVEGLHPRRTARSRVGSRCRPRHTRGVAGGDVRGREGPRGLVAGRPGGRRTRRPTRRGLPAGHGLARPAAGGVAESTRRRCALATRPRRRLSKRGCVGIWDSTYSTTARKAPAPAWLLPASLPCTATWGWRRFAFRASRCLQSGSQPTGCRCQATC